MTLRRKRIVKGSSRLASGLHPWIYSIIDSCNVRVYSSVHYQKGPDVQAEELAARKDKAKA